MSGSTILNPSNGFCDSALNLNQTPAAFQQLHGSGLIVVKSKDDTTSSMGFWYESTVSCQPQIYVLMMNYHHPLPSTLTLAQLYNRPEVSSIKIMKLKNTNDSFFRSVIYSAATSSGDHHAAQIHSLVMEKLVVASDAPLLDYLRMITALKPAATENTITNPYLIGAHVTQSANIDSKIEKATKMLKPYLKKHGTVLGDNKIKPKDLNALEQHLFDLAAVVNK